MASAFSEKNTSFGIYILVVEDSSEKLNAGYLLCAVEGRTRTLDNFDAVIEQKLLRRHA